MPKDITFKEVCNFIKNDDGELITATGNLLSAAILCSPIVFGPAALPALGLLGAKNELTALGKSLLSKLTSKEEADYLSRMRRMEIAYGLICYTSFFDALDRTLPDDLRKEIALQLEEKKLIVDQSVKRTVRKSLPQEDGLLIELEGPFSEPLLYPHPTSSIEDIESNHSRLYEKMTINFVKFVENLPVLKKADENKITRFHEPLKKLPKAAYECFEAQYFELSRKYEEFRIWMQIKEAKDHRMETSKFLREYNSLIIQAEKKIDVGLSRLQNTVLAIPYKFQEIKAQNVVDGLKRRYAARIEEAVIEDKEISEDNKPTLTFPKISEAFVPQSFQTLRYMSKEMHLEKEETWKKLAQKHDLAAFIVSYLSSPFSIESPLLILGHPGSGKSLLTKILSARLMSDAYTPIRIPLREVNAELGIEALVENQIEKDAQCRIDSWADFASQFTERPLLIILDGYDELLQASGKVFAGYLDKIQKFQQDQMVHKHPVRVIVTSRITLIDKATVPVGTTVLRLLEFGEKQRNAWIAIWNKVNSRYFSSSVPAVKPFALRKEKEGGKKDKILELAEQPLLLLMLALYDSEDNSLSTNSQLDRTVLYDSLLRRFVRRERRRYVNDFDHLKSNEQNEEIDNEMKRLGVAAIGMYNRRKLHVLASELSGDIDFFTLGRKLEVRTDRPLSEADLLLGSFFFIHKSSSVDGKEEHTVSDTAFEFLHNTFGEFLTADFILRFAFQEAEALFSLKNNDSLRAEFQRKIKDPNGLAKEWYACLMHAPLYSRPVIPEMLREWASHLLSKKQRKREDFLECLDEILKCQVKMALDSKAFPDIMKSDSASQFADIPFLGLIAPLY